MYISPTQRFSNQGSVDRGIITPSQDGHVDIWRRSSALSAYLNFHTACAATGAGAYCADRQTM